MHCEFINFHKMLARTKCNGELINLSTVTVKRKAIITGIASVYFNLISRCLQGNRRQNVHQLGATMLKRTSKCKISAEYTEPKMLLNNIYNMVCQRFGSNKWKPSFHYSLLRENSQALWKAELTLLWPTVFTEKGIASQKKSAEAIVAKKAIEWLRQQNVLDKQGHPIMYTMEEKLNLQEKWKAPCLINIKSDFEESLENLLNEYKEIEPKLNNYHDSLIWEPRFTEGTVEFVSDDLSCKLKGPNYSALVDVITGEKYKETEPEVLTSRSFSMYCKMKEKENNFDYCKMKKQRELLPITSKRKDILSLICDNSVIVLSGETGCGKTTQVPQFILDECIYSMEGSSCNVVVTQPRRISAISIANRVAEERCEKLGETIGYQVRLDKSLPTQKGAILYCTSGILLRRQQLNPYLEGISHIIVDEVHERSIEIDFLLTLLKRALEKNKTVKIILMSATINAELFSKYFDNCPIIYIPGFTYPVKQYFLEDINTMLNRKSDMAAKENLEVGVNVKLVTDLIYKIDSSRSSGAILCFLPGWQEIKAIRDKLLKLSGGQSRFTICPLHSSLPQNEQTLVFKPAFAGKRKVILATNIAETSITVNDVVYVIDSGCHNEVTYKSDKGISNLSTSYISKSNIQQRKGRAGRVQPGECFHLFSREDMDNMQDFPVPEMLRTSLENVVLASKICCPEESAVKFLSRTPQPPPVEHVEQAIQELQLLDILDDKEKLTILGRRVIYFSTHPRVSKAVIYSVIFRCLDPVLTIAAMLSTNRSPFDVGIEGRAVTREIKKKYNTSYPSDLLSFVKLFNEWSNITSQKEVLKFCQENMLNLHTMKFIQRLKELLLEHLIEAKLIQSADKNKDISPIFNEYSSNELMILSVLSNAFYPNILRIKQGSLDKGRINLRKINFSTLDGKNVRIPSDSTIYTSKELPSEFIVFTEKASVNGSILVKENSVIPKLVILYAGRNINMIFNEKTGTALLIIDGKKKLTFAASEKQCEMLMELHTCFNEVIKWSLCNSNESIKDVTVNDFVNKFMKTYVHLIQNSNESNYVHNDIEK